MEALIAAARDLTPKDHPAEHQGYEPRYWWFEKAKLERLRAALAPLAGETGEVSDTKRRA